MAIDEMAQAIDMRMGKGVRPVRSKGREGKGGVRKGLRASRNHGMERQIHAGRCLTREKQQV